MTRTLEVTILMKLTVNGHAGRIASLADLRRNLAPFASQQFREIWLRMDAGGPSLGGLINTNVGVLTYFRHDEGDTGFTTRTPMYDETDSTLGGLAFDGLYEGEHVRVVTYCWMSNGVEEEFPASWAVTQSDIMRALEHFAEHEGRRAPFLRWHDNAVAEPSHKVTQPEKGQFTVVLQSAGAMKIEVIVQVRFVTGLGLKEASDLIEGAPKNVIEGIARNEAEKIRAILEKAGATVEIKCSL
jgi:ribosomal protein L7/L12